MCGLAGLLGVSLNKKVSYELMTKAFEKAEVRGTDASGFWGTNQQEAVIYHKEPTKSSELVKMDAWRKVCNFSPDLLLAHARQATQGVGEPAINKNNHPFTNSSRTLSLIHNGRIPEFETLKRKFRVSSDCDSEILLRILEASNLSHTDQDIANLFPSFPLSVGYRLAGIMDIFSIINYGHMAVAIGEMTPDGTRHLWLFRNRHRSLWLVDLRSSLGQIFFCSTPEIWQEALQDSNRQLLGRQKLIEIPPEEVWYFQINSQEIHVKEVRRFEVEKEAEQHQWVDNGTPYPIQQQLVARLKLHTKLNENEELNGQRKQKEPQLSSPEIYQRCQEISNLCGNISTKAYNLIRESSLSEQEYQELLENLNQTKCELNGTLHLLDK